VPNVGVPCMESITKNSPLGHDPDSVPWIPAAAWQDPSTKWDGVPFDFCSYAPHGWGDPVVMVPLCKFVFPGAGIMRGLHDLYYNSVPIPFADKYNPTIAEIDNWNIKVIQHFRDLIGFKQKVSADRCLFLRAQWSQEMAFSRIWDAKYPNDSCALPQNANTHCGGGWIPNCADQAPYLNGGACCFKVAESESMLNSKDSYQWSIFMSRLLSSMCPGDSAHLGMFALREFMGISLACTGGAVSVRVKGSGEQAGPTC